MREYFQTADPGDAVWALYFLSGRKPRQIVPSKLLRDWSLELSGIPEWLFMESRDTVGDGAETMALLLFLGICVFLMTGFPVAFVLCGVSLLFAGIGVMIGAFDVSYLSALPNRIFGIMNN